MDMEKIKTLLEIGSKTAEEIRADAAAALVEIEKGQTELSSKQEEIAKKDDEIKKMKESNIRLYNMITVPKQQAALPPQEKTFEEKINSMVDIYMK